MTQRETAQPSEPALESWKAIAAYLNRDARTVMRWEKSEGLPVHRHKHLARSSVCAFPSELDAWRANRRLEPEGRGALPLRPRLRIGVVAVAVAAGVLCAGGGPFSGPIGALRSDVGDRPLMWPKSIRAASAVMSPDGRFVTYVDMETHELSLRVLRTGAIRQLTNIAARGGFVDASAISPAGNVVAFVAYEKDRVHRGLRILPLAASSPSAGRIVVEGGWYAPKEWFRDGNRILVVTDRDDGGSDIGVASVADGSLRVVKTIPYPGAGDHVSVSPDGQFIAYDIRAQTGRRERDVHVITADGRTNVALLTGATSDSVVGWAPDGRNLIFLSDRAGSDGVGLWAMPVAGGHASGVPSLLRADFRGDPMSLTFTGMLLFQRDLRVDDLLMTPIEMSGGRAPAPVAVAHDRRAFNRRPRWSADGQTFVYETWRPSGPVIAVKSLATGVVREVPLNLSYVWSFDLSPDGRWIVTRGLDLQNRKGILLVDTVTGDVRLIAQWTDKELYSQPQFSSGGTSVTYMKADFQGHASLVERDLATGVERVVAPAAGLGIALRRSPDGRMLLGADYAGGKTMLRLRDLDSGVTRDLFSMERENAVNPEDGVQWMPGGGAIVANIRGARVNERELWWIPIDGRHARMLDVGIGNIVDSAIAIDPTGTQIAFVAGDPVPSKTTVLKAEFRLLERFLPKRP